MIFEFYKQPRIMQICNTIVFMVYPVCRLNIADGCPVLTREILR